MSTVLVPCPGRENEFRFVSQLPSKPVEIPVPDTVDVHFDGGCVPNPGRMYGSWEISLNGKTVSRKIRCDLGPGTCNEAEFESLICALVEARVALGHLRSEYKLRIFTDSTIVRNRLKGLTRKCGHKRMTELCTKCFDYIKDFKAVEVIWRSRKHNVERFGH